MATTAAIKMNLVDQDTDKRGQTTTLTQVHHYGRLVIRVQVARDFYPAQSFATAAVLAGDLTWTVVATTPAADWHEGRNLERVAAGLAGRAATILAPVAC